MEYQMIDKFGLADPYAPFRGRQIGCRLFDADDLLLTYRFHRCRRWPVAYHVAELRRRPGRELSVAKAVDQTSIMKHIEKFAVVGDIHQIEIAVDRRRDALNLVHTSLRFNQCAGTTVAQAQAEC